jgi:hypothetical protein
VSNLFKKAMGIFVEYPGGKKPEEGTEPPGEEDGAEATAPAQPLADAPEDLSVDPDVQRTREAIRLLASLPLDGIPVEKARELVARTLEFAGMEPEALQASFRRAGELFRAQIGGEKAKIAVRQQQSQERLQLLEAATAEEKQQCAAEVTARNGLVEQATSDLSEIDKAAAFFAPEEPQEGV